MNAVESLSLLSGLTSIHPLAITEWGCGYFWDNNQDGARCALGSAANYQTYFENNNKVFTTLRANGQPIVIQANYFEGLQGPLGTFEAPSSISMFLASGGGTNHENVNLFTGFGNALTPYPYAGGSSGGGTSTPTPTPTPTQTSTSGNGSNLGSGSGSGNTVYYLESTSRGTTLAMNAWGGSRSGAAVGDYAVSASPNEQFVFNSSGQLQANGTSLCVGLRNGGTGNGTHLVLETCSASASDQQWTFVASSSANPNEGQVKSTQTGRCLDINEGNYATDQVLQIWDCHLPIAGNQTWNLKTSP